MTREHRVIGGEQDLEHPGLRSVYCAWDTARKGAIGPPAVDLLNVPDMISHCMVLRLEDGQSPGEAVVRYVGSEFRRVTGFEMTGMSVAGMVAYPTTAAFLVDGLSRGVPLVCGPRQGDNLARNFVVLTQVCLPLSEDGRTVDGALFAGHTDPAPLTEQEGRRL